VIAIAEVRFLAPPDPNRQPDDQHFGLFCQYSTGVKQLIGLVV
jgi:hypothetical protein